MLDNKNGMRYSLDMRYEDALKNCCFRYVSGSHAYGTQRDDGSSDKDIRGVFIAPLSKAFELYQSEFVGSGSISVHLKNALGDLDAGLVQPAIDKIKLAMDPENGDLAFSVGTVKKPGEDEELHELRKFLKLAAENNPNIEEALWIDRLILHETPIWKKIRGNRHLFLSKKARWTFACYAVSQMKRIEVHRGYLLNPPDHMPTRAEFDLPGFSEIAKENQNALLSLPDKWVSEEAKEYVRNEKRYHAALDQWNSYKKWERERNPARKAIEAKFGIDCKHAMHLVRLCRMGVEILRDGIVNVYRPDREELKGILKGSMTYDDLVKMVSETDKKLDELYKTSPLRDRADLKGISNLYMEICEEHYGIKL